ncbi:50S ribosomal protein L23 [bacterium]|jgi:large subunit ribosomal protein L23|nr:50S ribosomal protein L23 [bacterium]NSW80769.1 50S ribosomal protein L23 [bacterium]NSX01820.1 50S ribosomal protein L23 [Deltaproteobacteria bacterium TMED58]RZP16173.1 MAG: 50S ribosomal protein L23 [Candidatus Dadabacteria bacterium]|tara:strand:+ start:101179 stop:101469 length:291 start_codon:yes stop_codon:yes gene_type:complete
MKKYVSDIILKPLITEKTQVMNQDECYVFEVNPKSTKNEIKDAIQKFFDVKVKDIRTSIKPGKKVLRGGRPVGKRSKQKKAFITLKEGKIEIVQGV